MDRQFVQAAARAERRAIPAKGLTGRGYDGHTFWDMETLRPGTALRLSYPAFPPSTRRSKQLHPTD
jgi:hypothetical protein